MVVRPTWGRRPRLPNYLLFAISLVAASGCAAPAWFKSADDTDFPIPDMQGARVYPRAATSRSSQPAARNTWPKPTEKPPAEQQTSSAQSSEKQATSPRPAPRPSASLPDVHDVAPLHGRATAERLPSEVATPKTVGQPHPSHTAVSVPVTVGPSGVVVAAATEAIIGTIKPAVATKHAVATQDSAEEKSPSDLSAKEEAAAKPPPYQSGDWLKARDQLIAVLQEEIQLAKNDPARVEQAAQLETTLRMQQALAGQREEAAEAVAGLRESEQEFWRHQALGLADLLGPERLASESRRFAVALKSLEEAEVHLAAAASLTLRNLALCRKVQDFGVIERFARNDFSKSQEVLLYVEVRNFAAQERDDHSYETELQGSFRVLDRTGTARAERTLPLDKQTCANLRRDYYIAYRLYIPSELAPGAYTLELTIEDKKGNKSNNALLDFNVVP